MEFSLVVLTENRWTAQVVRRESILPNGIIEKRKPFFDVTTVFITGLETKLGDGLITMHQCLIGFGLASTGSPVT